MKKNLLELRMYFFVPYNISSIQKAIQAGHAALEYACKYGHTALFKDFAHNWKTWVILNGGTTNDEKDENDIHIGTLNQIGAQLFDNNIDFSGFREPDLNNALTALCFIVDERVFNEEDYPDINDYISTQAEDIEFSEIYNEWIELIGGKKNEFLRELLNNKKLA
jgi:hypothetical protein